jgi:hypothetical protein
MFPAPLRARPGGLNPPKQAPISTTDGSSSNDINKLELAREFGVEIRYYRQAQ